MDFRYEQIKDGRWKAGDTTSTIANSARGASMLAKGLKDGSIKTPTVTSEGACRGICTWWLIQRCLGNDFWDWFGPPQSASPQSKLKDGKAGTPVHVIKDIMRDQDRFISMNGFLPVNQLREMNHRQAGKYVLDWTSKQLSNGRGLVSANDANWAWLGNQVESAVGFCYISFNVSGWGGHALAAQVHADGNIEFLDPNQGEFDCAPGQFSLLMSHMASAYPKSLHWAGVQTLSLIR
jgi:hypothetical protein